MNSQETTKREFEDLNTYLYRKIKEMIGEKELAPGEKIKQTELAEQLGVSRTPLLKVLHRLASENVVEYTPRRGFNVKKLSMDELLEIFKVREVIQGVSARTVAENASDEEVRELKGYFKPFMDQLDDKDLDDYIKADKKFHNRMIELANNSLIIKINDMFNINRFSYQKGLIRPPRETLSEHLKIINALEKREAFEAQLSAMDHMEKTCCFISEKLGNEDNNILEGE